MQPIMVVQCDPASHPCLQTQVVGLVDGKN